MNTLNNLLLAVILLGLPINAESETVQSEMIQIQRVRIDFRSPTGFTRHLLLAFTPDNAASDEVDYGYDALNIDNYPDDMNWLINDQRYVIQGVGEFHESKSYPLAVFLSNAGPIEISLTSLEHFDTEIDVYIYDALLGNFTAINTQNYSSVLTTGNYLDRFYITFTNDISQLNFSNNALTIQESNIENTFINYLYQSNELMLDTKNEYIIKEVTIYNLNGMEIFNLDINSDKIKIPLHFIRSSALIVQITSEYGDNHYKQIVKW